MWRKSLLLILFVFPTVLFAQRECKVSGEFTYYAPLNVSPDDAIAIAVENDCRGTTALQPNGGVVGLSHRGSRRINGKLTASNLQLRGGFMVDCVCYVWRWVAAL